MPLPDLRTYCIDLDVTPGDLCITFPGGTEVCAHFPSLVPPSPDELVRQLFAQMNAALAPLAPVFNIIDVVIAIFDCIKAISTLNPQEILECIPGLAEKVAALLKLIPQLSIPVLVVQFLDILILFLKGNLNQLLRQEAYLRRILAAETASKRPGNVGLDSAIVCAKDDLRNLIQYFNEGSTPVNRLIGIINLFLELIGLGKYAIPTLGVVDPDQLSQTAQLLTLTIDLMTQLRNAIAPIAGQISAPFDAAAEAIDPE